MISSFKRLWGDCKGNTLVIAGAALPLIIASAGLATDTIQWTLWKRELQRAADSGAMAGVYDRVRAGNTATAGAAVSHDLTLNHHTGITLLSGYPNVSFPADSGDMRNQVQVVLGIQKELPFSSMFLSTSPIIIATSRAASVPGADEYCVVALETNAAKTGITIGGSAAIEMNCGIISNSPSANSSAINNGNASSVIASVLASVGGMQYSNNWQIGKYDPYATAVQDPYGDIDPIASEMTSCANNPPALTDATNVTNIHGGCFSSLDVGSNKSLTLNPGTYYITGKNANTAGGANVQGNLSCNGCTFVLTNKDMSSTAKIGSFDMNAQAAMNVTAPSTGKYKGIAVFQDRRATDTNGNNAPNKFNGGGAMTIKGALYFPKQAIAYSGNGSATAVCTRFVGRRVTFTGNSAVSNKFEKGSSCAMFGDDPIGGGRRVRLVA